MFERMQELFNEYFMVRCCETFWPRNDRIVEFETNLIRIEKLQVACMLHYINKPGYIQVEP